MVYHAAFFTLPYVYFLEAIKSPLSSSKVKLHLLFKLFSYLSIIILNWWELVKLFIHKFSSSCIDLLFTNCIFFKKGFLLLNHQSLEWLRKQNYLKMVLEKFYDFFQIIIQHGWNITLHKQKRENCSPRWKIFKR